MIKKKMILSAIMAGVLSLGTLTPVGNVVSPLSVTAEAAAVRTDFNNKILYISPYVNPSLRMDIEGGRNYNEVNCGAYFQNSGDNQKFEATLKFTDSNGTGWYRLRPLSDYNGNMGLNVNYGSNYGNLQLYEYSYIGNMLFAFEKASDGYSYNIRAYCGGYLDITGSFDGANIYRNENKTCSNTQKWLVTDTSTEQMTSFSFPSQPIPSSLEKGKSQVISGCVSADNSPLYSVTAEILGTQYIKTIYTSNYKYELPYSELDNSIKFAKLEAGDYTLRLSAVAANGKKASFDYNFTVKGNSTVSSSIGTFDINKALSYAETYAENYNPAYGFYGVGGRFTYNPTSADMGENGNDCVHFVWQILREAGLNIDQKLINVSEMRNYFKPYVSYISYPSISDISVGDVLLTSSGHLTFVSKRDGNNVYICSHTNPRKNFRVTSLHAVIKTSNLIKAAAAETNVVYGDVNNDGKAYTISDILAIKLYIADPSSVSKFNLKAADLDFDGKITDNDLQILKRRSVGLPDIDTAPTTTTSENLSFSENGLSFLCGLEGFHSTCYNDSTQSSIGYGTKCPYSSYIHASGSHSITKEQAMADMKSQINSRYAVTTRKQLGNIALTQNQFDSLVSLCYNTGGGTSIISNSPLVKYLKGELTEAQARSQYSNYYVKSNGKILQGLINRRNKEADLFFTK